MDSEKIELLSISPKSFKFKVNTENRRMKLYIKLSKAETERWDSIKDASKPPDISDNEFARFIFFRGLDAMMSDLVERINNLTDDERKKIIEEHGDEMEEVLDEAKTIIAEGSKESEIIEK
jgi:hypothetical protein|tara:strand:- start:565 stop:927 length:363 start_codon:yes stop_codon:yes gene_type:complete